MAKGRQSLNASYTAVKYVTCLLLNKDIKGYIVNK